MVKLTWHSEYNIHFIWLGGGELFTEKLLFSIGITVQKFRVAEIFFFMFFERSQKNMLTKAVK